MTIETAITLVILSVVFTVLDKQMEKKKRDSYRK